MADIKLRFIEGVGWVSEAICKFTWSRWSHVEAWTPEGYLGAQTEGGVQIRPYDYCKVKAEAFATYSLPEADAQKVLEFLRAQIGKPYDFKAIAGFLFHRDWVAAAHWFCSELQAAAPDIAAHSPLLKVDQHKDNRISPGMLAMSPRLNWC
jgi:uncharacterized protein YycO